MMTTTSGRRKYKGPLRAVLFDWAGTVLDFGSRAPVLAVMRTFAEFDVPLSTEEARGPMGMSKRDHLRALVDLPRVRDHWRETHNETPGEEAVDRLYRAFLATQQEVLVEHAALIPGAAATLEHCRRRGLRLGSSTGYTKPLMEVLIPAARAQGLEFEAVVCADDVPQGRPAPWMCLENARQLGVFPMEAIVAVDDTTVGIEAGLNAGMWTVGVAASGNLMGLSESELLALDADDQKARVEAASQKLLASGADFAVPSVADLPGVLDEIERRLRKSAF